MMRYIRNNAVFVLIVVVFVVAVFIGTIFLVWGRGSTSSPQSERSVAAWVGTEEVPYAEFSRAHDSRVEFYRRFYPGVSAAELEKRFQIKKSALDAAIGRRLLVEEGRRMGLTVTNEEIAAKIRETAMFQQDGVFDPKKYREILSASGVKTAAYEEEVRGELLANKVRAVVQEPVRVAEAEAFEEYRRDKEQVRLTLVILPPAPPLAQADVPEQEARRQYDADPAKYTRPERVRFAHFTMQAKDFQPAGVATEEQLRDYYEQNTDEFRTERSVNARHILLRLAEDASAEEEAKIKDRAQFVLDKAKAGTDFSALAREFSQDSSGPAGGGLGWFSTGQMVPAFEQAALALEKGQVSDLVRTQYGLHIIKVDEVREAGLPTFEQSREQVARSFAAAATRAAITSRVERINDELTDGEFDAVAAKFGVVVRTTELLTREGPIPGPGSRPEAVDGLFALAEGEISEMQRQGEDYWAYKVLEKQASAVPSFEEARPQVERELLAARARVRDLAQGRLLLGDLRRGESPGALAARAKGQVKETAFFTQRSFVAEAGVSGDLFQEAFDAAPGSFGGPTATPDGRIVIFRVDAKLAAAREGFETEKDEIVTRLRSAKKDQFFDAWLEDLRRVRAVKINQALVGRL